MGYVTQDEFATWLDMGDTVAHERAARLDRAIEAATGSINRITRRHFRPPSATEETWRYFGGGTSFDHVTTLLIRDAATVTEVTIDGEPLAADEYAEQVEDDGWPVTGLVRLTEGGLPGNWGGVSNSGYYLYNPYRGATRPVDVTGTWGWAEVPAGVAEACLYLATRFLKRTQMQYGQPDNAGGGLWYPRFDPDVTELLSTYRRQAVGGRILPVRVA